LYIITNTATSSPSTTANQDVFDGDVVAVLDVAVVDGDCYVVVCCLKI